MESRAELGLEPVLKTEVAVPDQPFEEGIDKGHDQRGRHQLRAELCPLGDAARDDRGNRCGEGQQEEELHQRVAVFVRQLRRRLQKSHAIGDPVADEEIGQGRDSEVRENFRQRIDLVLQAHRANFQESEARVHGQHHDRAHQEEQRVGAVDQRLYGTIEVFHRYRQPRRSRGKHQNGSRRPCAAPR